MMMSNDGGPNRKLATQKLLPGLDHTGQPVLEPLGGLNNNDMMIIAPNMIIINNSEKYSGWITLGNWCWSRLGKLQTCQNISKNKYTLDKPPDVAKTNLPAGRGHCSTTVQDWRS